MTDYGGTMDKRYNSTLLALTVGSKGENVLALVKNLNLFGIESKQTDSVRQAIKMARKKEYHLIFIEQDTSDIDDHVINRLRGIYARKKVVIYIMASEVTKEVISHYEGNGADGVCKTPIGENELARILYMHYREQIQGFLIENKMEEEEVNLSPRLPSLTSEKRIKYCGGDKKKYISLLRKTLKEIDNIIEWMKRHNVKVRPERFRTKICDLRNVFLEIGELELLKQSNLMETLLEQEDPFIIDSYLLVYINHIENFKSGLEYALSKFEMEEKKLEDNGGNCSYFLSDEEYEQCLLNTIYYIKISDYDSIINELVRLLHLGKTAFKEELKKALEDVLEFEYEKALKRIMNVKALTHINAVTESIKKAPDETI